MLVKLLINVVLYIFGACDKIKLSGFGHDSSEMQIPHKDKLAAYELWDYDFMIHYISSGGTRIFFSYETILIVN